MRPSVLLFYLVPIIAAAFLATLAGASIGSLSGWGFPFQWKIGGCTNINGGLVCAEEFDNLLFFAADIAFFGLVGYAVVFVGYWLFLVLGTVLQPRRIFGPELWLSTCLEDLPRQLSSALCPGERDLLRLDILRRRYSLLHDGRLRRPPILAPET